MPGYATVRRFMKDTACFASRSAAAAKAATRSWCRARRARTSPRTSTRSGTSTSTKARGQVLTAAGDVENALSVRHARRLLARVLPRAVVSRPRRTPRTWSMASARAFQKRKLPRARPQRQRLGDESRRDRRGARPARHRAVPDAARTAHSRTASRSTSGRRSRAASCRCSKASRCSRSSCSTPPTQAWVEQEYHRTVHGELGKTPLQRYLEGPDVGRDVPRAPTRSDAPFAWRSRAHSAGATAPSPSRASASRCPRPTARWSRLRLRVARWDLSSVDLVDPRTGTHLATLLPLDKVKNADRARRVLAEATSPPAPSKKPPGIAPLLRELMAEYAATGLPPAYLPEEQVERLERRAE